MRRLLTAVLLLVLPIPASSQSYGEWQATREWLDVCGGTDEYMCASVRLDLSPTAIRLRLMNLGGLYESSAETRFTGFTIGGLPFLNDPRGPDAPFANHYGWIPIEGGDRRQGTGPSASEWIYGYTSYTLGHQLDRFSMNSELWPNYVNGDYYWGGSLASSCEMSNFAEQGYVALFVSPTCGADGLANPHLNGGWFEEIFDFREGFYMDPPDLGAVYVTISGLGSSLTCGGANSNCHVVPEPATAALLGSGLMGLAGMARRRRRRSMEKEEEEG